MKQVKKMCRSTKRLCKTAQTFICLSMDPTAQVGLMMAPQSLQPTPHWSSCSRNGLQPDATKPPLHMTFPLYLGTLFARSGWTGTAMGSVTGLCQVGPSLAPACPAVLLCKIALTLYRKHLYDPFGVPHLLICPCRMDLSVADCARVRSGRKGLH